MTRPTRSLVAVLSVLAASACGGGPAADTDAGARDAAVTPDAPRTDGAAGTVLAVDCRERGGDERCEPFSDAAAGSIGDGPTLPGGTGGMYGGYVDAAGNRIVIAGYDFMDQGYVLAVDLTSGDRTLVSGTHYDARTGNETRGTGPDLGQLYDVDLGPDGRLFTFGENGLHAIDAATGDRTMIAPGGSDACMHAGRAWFFGNNANTSDSGPGLAIGSDGALYTALSTPFMGAGSEFHAGIVRIDLAGACTVVTMSSDNVAYRVGTGPEATDQITGLAFVGSTLYWTTWPAGNVFSVDTSTGARRLIASGNVGMEVGEGPSADTGFLAPLGTTTLWTSGDTSGLERGGSTLVSVDIASGDRTGYDWDDDGPLGGFNEAWWAYPHPTLAGVAIVAAGNGGLDHAIVLMELSTGNHHLLSR